MTTFAPIRAAGGFLLLFVSLVAIGCGSEKATGTVTGTVKYKSSPLAIGDVNFLSKSGVAAIGKIDSSGHFKVDSPMAAGDYKVYVTPPLPEPQAPGAKTTPPAKFDVPMKFRDPNSSGVTVTVKSGSNDLLIEFKD